jgi:hypothetical protein
MLPLIAITATVILAIGIPVAKKVRRHCRATPGLRLPLLIGALAVLAGAAFAAPLIDNVAPHMRESPAGIVPILGAAAGVALAALLALSTVTGVALSRRSRRDDPTDDI